MFSNPIYYVVILIAAGGIAFYYWWTKRHKSTDSSDDEKESGNIKLRSGNIPVRLADDLSNPPRIYNTTISGAEADKIIEKFGSLGRQWDRNGAKIYGLHRFKNKDNIEVLEPIVIPSRINNAPRALYNDIQQPGMGLMIQEMLKDEEKPFLEKYGNLLWWLAVMGFLAFMWANS